MITLRKTTTENAMDMEQQREEQVMALVGRYFDGRELPEILVPSLEEAEVMLLSAKPQEWWGNGQDVYEWALRAMDEISDGREYMVSNGRGHDLHSLIECEEF